MPFFSLFSVYFGFCYTILHKHRGCAFPILHKRRASFEPQVSVRLCGIDGRGFGKTPLPIHAANRKTGRKKETTQKLISLFIAAMMALSFTPPSLLAAARPPSGFRAAAQAAREPSLLRKRAECAALFAVPPVLRNAALTYRNRSRNLTNIAYSYCIINTASSRCCGRPSIVKAAGKRDPAAFLCPIACKIPRRFLCPSACKNPHRSLVFAAAKPVSGASA